MNLSDQDINSPSLLEEEKLKEALAHILTAVTFNKKALIIVDCDCDGYTSAALLINYLNNLFPTWVENCLDWYMKTKNHLRRYGACSELLAQGKQLVASAWVQFRTEGTQHIRETISR